MSLFEKTHKLEFTHRSQFKLKIGMHLITKE